MGIEPLFRTIDGLSIRFAESERRETQRGDALLLNPWPESLYAYEAAWPRLTEHAHLIAIDLPGFGHSERRVSLLTPRAMSEFVVQAADAFGLERPHLVGPDIGTSAALFAASSHPARFRSIVVGTGATAVPLELGDRLREWVEGDIEPYRDIDGCKIVKRAIGSLERYKPTDAAREDYLSSYAGTRFFDSIPYVRAYPTDLPILRDLLPKIQTPTLIVNGKRDSLVPPSNATFLSDRLPNSKVAMLDAGHFIWEDAAEEYSALVAQWWDSH